jgi:hypothetical protein
MGIAGRGSSLGTTLRDHINLDGDPGRNQETVKAYGREGEPCFVCGTAMRRIKVGGRSSVFCPSCQRPPRTRRAPKKPPAKRVKKRVARPRLLAKPAVSA